MILYLKCKLLCFLGFMVLVMELESITLHDVKCDVNCVCSKGIMTCNKYMPNILPDGIHSLTIEGNAEEKHEFWTDKSWRRLKSLTLHNYTSNGLRDVYEFQNIINLEYFGLHSSKFDILEKNHLAKLVNLKCLNLSMSRTLKFATIMSALEGNILPNLEVLDLDSVASAQERTSINVFGRSFCAALRRKPIKKLIITNTLLLFDIGPYIFSSLPLLEFLNISGPWIPKVSGEELFVDKKGLQTFDLSVSAISVFKTGGDLVLSETLTDNCRVTPFAYFLMQITNVYLNDIVEMEVTLTYTLNLTRCLHDNNVIFAIKTLHLRRNGLKKLNIKILDSAHIGLTVLDLAENILEFISSDFFKLFTNLSHLDLSFNRLYKMELDPHFQGLFVHLKGLTVLKLSSNRLSFLPVDIFKQNENLLHLDLSNNKFFNVMFSVRHLKSLNVLNLADNNLKFLDKGFVKQLDKLDLSPSFSKFQDENNTNVIILSNNRLHCSCNSVAFLNWLLLRYNNTDVEHQVTCHLEEAVTKIDKESVAKSKYLCIKKVITIIICTAVAISVVVITGVTYACYSRHRRRVKMIRVDGLLHDLLQQGAQKYLIYLSYAEGDEDLVLNDICPQLARELRARVGFNKDLICKGAVAFRPGYPIHEQMVRCISESCTVVCVVSNEFCSSRFCKAEVREAAFQDKDFFLFQVDGVDESLMSQYVRTVARRQTKVRLSALDNHSVFTPDLHTVLKLLLEKAADKYRSFDSTNDTHGKMLKNLPIYSMTRMGICERNRCCFFHDTPRNM